MFVKFIHFCDCYTARMRLSRVHWKKINQLSIVGCSNGAGGRYLGCEKAVQTMQKSKIFKQSTLNRKWCSIIQGTPIEKRHLSALPDLITMTNDLANAVMKVTNKGNDLVVIGGDHSCAIGTWSGVARSCHHKGKIGLLWIDAHMDSHTCITSHTGNLHGMPVSHLLGYGDPRLSDILGISPKILPQNLALVGIRSFEPEEKALLEKHKVAVFYDSDILKRGLKDVMDEALQIVQSGTYGYGMSIDLDGFRIQDAPAVGTPEKGGINAVEFLKYLRHDMDLRRLIATEVVEFMPKKDINNVTEKLIVNILESIYFKKWNN